MFDSFGQSDESAADVDIMYRNARGVGKTLPFSAHPETNVINRRSNLHQSMLYTCRSLRQPRAVITADGCLFRWTEARSKLNVLSIQPLIGSLVLLCRLSTLQERMKDGGDINSLTWKKGLILQDSCQDCVVSPLIMGLQGTGCPGDTTDIKSS